MRTPPRTPLRVALLSTWIVGGAGTLHADGPLVVPDDQAVNVVVDPGTDGNGHHEQGAGFARAPGEDRPLGGAAPPPPTAEQVPAPAAPDGGLGTPRDEIFRVGGPLLAVVTLMLVLGAAVRRFGGPLARGGRPAGVLEVLGRYPIARGQQLILLRMVSRVVLLHQGRNGLTTLSEITDADEVAALLARVESASTPGQPGRFQGLLAGAAARQDDLDHGVSTHGKVVVDLTRRPARHALRSAVT